MAGKKSAWTFQVPPAARVAIAVIVSLIGYILLFGQFYNNWFAFASVWSRRLYPVVCLAIVAIGWALAQRTVIDALKLGLIAFVANIVALLIVGGAIYLGDISNGTDFAGGSLWISLDLMSGLSVFNTVVNALPQILGAVAVILGVIALYMGDNWDEYMTAILETALVLALIGIYGLL